MNFNRAVIKVGSALISPDANGCSGKFVADIANFINQCQANGKEIILVSSGSVAAGRSLIQHGSPIPSIPAKQAMASVGQMQMMANWQKYINLSCSQLLITHADLKNRERYINIKNTLRVLLENNILPIVNENDTVATDELKVGDNDNLAALVALVSEADCLFILSDIDGVYNADPRSNPDATMFSEIPNITPEIYAMAGSTTNVIATGGMKTKIQAADKATENGIDTYIINGSKPKVFEKLIEGENPGTRFVAQQAATKAKQQWLKHTLKINGQLILDCGACNAVLNNGASLLASGIKEVNGNFAEGELIELINEKSKQVIAKGISQYNYRDLNKIKGHKSDQIDQLLGYCPSKVIVHRDDMVIVA